MAAAAAHSRSRMFKAIAEKQQNALHQQQYATTQQALRQEHNAIIQQAQVSKFLFVLLFCWDTLLFSCLL